MRKILLFALFLILLIGNCACNNLPDTQSTSKNTGLHTVASNVCLKTGLDTGNTVLESEDFIGFKYSYNESSRGYTFLFQLTDDGQKKMTEATTKLAETSGDLTFWIGDEPITTSKVNEAITEDVFALDIDLNEDEITHFVNKLEGE